MPAFIEGRIRIEAEAIRRVLSPAQRTMPELLYDELYGNKPRDPLAALRALIDAEVNDFAGALMAECIAEWALELGVDEYLRGQADG